MRVFLRAERTEKKFLSEERRLFPSVSCLVAFLTPIFLRSWWQCYSRCCYRIYAYSVGLPEGFFRLSHSLFVKVNNCRWVIQLANPSSDLDKLLLQSECYLLHPDATRLIAEYWFIGIRRQHKHWETGHGSWITSHKHVFEVSREVWPEMDYRQVLHFLFMSILIAVYPAIIDLSDFFEFKSVHWVYLQSAHQKMSPKFSSCSCHSWKSNFQILNAFMQNFDQIQLFVDAFVVDYF